MTQTMTDASRMNIVDIEIMLYYYRIMNFRDFVNGVYKRCTKMFLGIELRHFHHFGDHCDHRKVITFKVITKKWSLLG